MSSAFDDEWAGANLDLNDAFGEVVQLTALGRDITAVVDIPVLEQNIGRISTELPDPSFTAQDYLLAGVVEGQVVTMRGETYAVVRTMPDGTGWTKVAVAPHQSAFVNDFT